jgi:ribonuclease E
MPNNPRGGGVSRRVEGEDRQELRDTMEQLDLPQGMSIIARTAGIGRNVEELQWDLSYLLQLWTAIDGAARDNSAPILIYLESSLVIRAIRDYFSPEIGEILIDTDEIADQATAFMSVVMPDNVQRVKRYRDDIPLFSRFQIEHQIETAYSRTVTLPSGGAIVIDHTEALVSVDVNSARSTRGADIEETALRTNSEAADEVARQLRLRDLGGLIVIDFIDMEDSKNQRAVEQRLRDALHFDRARVQMGKISRFGLMELSRQRLRPALNEGSHITCPRCNGTGVIRDAESSALHVLRLLQEEAMKENTAAVHAQVPVDVATYLLNEKRADITKMEARLKVNLMLIPNKHLETPHHHIERLRHDDPRLEELKTSFELVEAPATDAPWQPREHEIKSRPEALVKGITPSQPAPVSTPAPAAPAPAPAATGGLGGLFKRLFGWLGGSSEAAKPAPAAQEDSAKRASSGRGKGRSSHDGQERRGERHGSDRNRNRRGESRGEGAEGSEGGRHHVRGNRRAEGERQERGDRNNRNDARGERDTQAAQAALASNRPEQAVEAGGEDSGAGRNRRRGRGRNRREEGQSDAPMSEQESMVAALAQTVATALPETKPAPEAAAVTAEAGEAEAVLEQTADGVPAVEGAEGAADPERKRRRRRSRRGRRSQEEAGLAGSDDQQEDGADDDSIEQSEEAAAQPAVTAAQTEEPAAHVQAAPAQAQQPETTTAEPVQVAAAPVETQPAAPVQAQAEQAVEPVAQPVQTAAAEVTQPVSVQAASEVSAPAATEPAPVEAAAVEPVVAPAPAPVAPVAPAAPVAQEAAAATPAASQPIVVPAVAPSAKAQALHDVVNAAGLQWVETDPDRHAQTQLRIAAAHTPVRLGRERKPVAPVSNEPLVQVETRH